MRSGLSEIERSPYGVGHAHQAKLCSKHTTTIFDGIMVSEIPVRESVIPTRIETALSFLCSSLNILRLIPLSHGFSFGPFDSFGDRVKFLVGSAVMLPKVVHEVVHTPRISHWNVL
jgi:hypothetical protein